MASTLVSEPRNAAMLQPCDVDRQWPRIVPMVERIIRRMGDATTPEAVLEKIKAGEAHLWVEPEGFLIWRLQREADGSRTLFVWFIWGRCARGVDFYEDQLREMARVGQADRIAFRSTRGGWERYLADHWRVAHVQYEWRLGDGW